MKTDYMCIVLGRKDGTEISQDVFWLEHADINLSTSQRKRLLENVETQATKFLEKNWNKKHEDVRIDNVCAGFTFRDPITGELFFTPLYKMDVCVVFRKMETAYLFIYDLRRAFHNV